MKGFAFGQFYPANSLLHHMDPRAKVICAVAYIVASFLCKNTFSFLLLLVSAFALILISRIPMRVVLRSIKALIFIMAFTAVLNIFWIVDTTEGATPLVDFWVIKIYAKGLYHAVFILVRILAMVIGTGLFLTYTTIEPKCREAVLGAIEQHGNFEEMIECTAGCTVSCHCGPGTLGVLFVRK